MTVLAQVQGQAGMRAASSAIHRIVTKGGMIAGMPVGRILSGECSRDPGNTPVTRLRAGILLGQISTVVNSLGTVGHYAPSILGVTTNAEAAGSTAIEATAAVVTELVRRCGATGTFLLRGVGSSAGTVQSETVTYSAASSTNITVTAIVNNYLAGAFIQPTDGSADPLTFIANGFPMEAVDQDGTSVAQDLRNVPIAAVIDSAQLLPVWPSDTSLRAWIVSRLSQTGGGQFTFNHII